MSWLGFFYGGNIAGAVLGCLAAGFYLLRVYDTSIATYVAVALNLLVASLAAILARTAPATATGRAGRARADIKPAPGAWAIYVAIGLSGMTALSAEVIWTRILSLLFGATVYTFSLILAVFLTGLGIGSSLGAAIGRGIERPRVALGICQVLLCAAIAWTAYVVTASLPYWPINPSMASSPWFTLQLDLVRCLWAVLPAAILWGASFPLALASVASPGQDPARLVGGVYAANTVGRHRRVARREPRAGGVDRQPARAAGADCRLAARRASGARLGRPRPGADAGHRAVDDHGRPGRGRRPGGACSRARSPKCRACSSRTAVTPRRAAARIRSSTRTRA